MRPQLHLLVFTLDRQRYALHLAAVERVVRAVYVTPLPNAPAIVLGVLNAQGRVIPVVNMRKRFGLPERDILPSDKLILARTSKRSVALASDEVMGVLERPEAEVVPSSAVLPETPFVAGVVKLDDGLVFLHDLNSFLGWEEEAALEAALA